MKEFFKSKKKMAIIAGVLIAVITIGTISVNANAAMKVEAYTADIGGLSSILEINGNVESDSMKTYYSKVDGTIGKVLDQQIADTQAALIQKQNDLANKRAALADEGAKLQISLLEWADKPDSEGFENLQKLVQTNAYEQQYSSEILQMQEEINRLGVALEGYKTYKAEMSSQKAATQMGLMTDGTFVFVVKDDKAVKTKVETGARNDSMVEICEGIAEGDVVVWNETSEITDGMSVKLD